ncbi:MULTISPECIES: DUF202 domain-containing protein [Arthrobacter]|uniref:DUF202 domain-containing protein n=2 Tax=Arthrobacter TaxID=1663 RepID=A0ABU9KQ04_9MICC|nr:DUF202 domain-containing protein [Arthrobacter sp. YJM1]MDP5228355.1 DUF202 domain-containing protein [Arthrobacter sp. YJM1]
MSRDVPARDPGLQPQRTALAWRRTLLSLLVVDFFILRSWMFPRSDGSGEVTVVNGVAVAAAGVATVVVCTFAVQRVRHLRDGEGAPRALAIAGVSAAVCLLACCAVAVMLVR